MLAPQQTIVRVSANLRCEGATANHRYFNFERPWFFLYFEHSTHKTISGISLTAQSRERIHSDKASPFFSRTALQVIDSRPQVALLAAEGNAARGRR